MGRFDGALLLSDFDNTLLYTEEGLRTGAALPPLPERNLAAIRRWMAKGGVFAVATGRAMAAYRRYAGMIPTNAPAIVDNGGGIYDYRREAYVYATALPETTRLRLAAVREAFPQVSLELYHPDGGIQVVNPSPWNARHAQLTGVTYQVAADLEEGTVGTALSKALFVAEHGELERVREFLARRGWAEDYELIFSSGHLLEMTARGADKGAMALRLKALCRCEKLYCVGDHMNDLPMLRLADAAFAPANAVEEVLSSGVRVVCHCREGAVGAVIEALEAGEPEGAPGVSL